VPTAILNIDFNNVPKQITGLNSYSHALILLRYKGRPLGKTIVPVSEGCIVVRDHYNHFLDSAGGNLWDQWLFEYLDWNQADLIKDFVPPKATVAVCTRNRTEDLRRCLDALMQMPDDGQEFLVIDNCPSNDDTQQLVKLYSRVRYVLESRPGLNIARNRALTEARNDVVAFTDDDATPDINWLRSIVRNFNNSLVKCVTGLTLPLELETDGQEAFEKYSPFGKGFKRIVHSGQSRNPLSTGEVGAGANMALHKSLLQDIGYFDEALDAGTITHSGGDHEYFARILIAGYNIVYEPEALSWHRHRRTLEETRKAIYGYGVGVYAFWTRLLFLERELHILKFPWYWFRYTQFPNLVKSITGRPGSQPLNLVLAELKGCIIGPASYRKARNISKSKNVNS
jgi:glycosyltransferase involved in cell wall biosynthesis